MRACVFMYMSALIVKEREGEGEVELSAMMLLTGIEKVFSIDVQATTERNLPLSHLLSMWYKVFQYDEYVEYCKIAWW